MASTVKRRPLPALVSLLALLLLAALIWWRVLHRSDTSTGASACPSASASVSTTPSAISLPAPAAITVTVLNGTSRAGIAGNARKALVAAGFNVPAAAANESPKRKITGTGQIRYGPKGKQAAVTLRYYFPGATLAPIASTRSTVIVSLGPKYKQVASATTVRQALRADKIVLSTPTPTPSTTVGAASSSPSC